jgi:hypothetical protein
VAIARISSLVVEIDLADNDPFKRPFPRATTELVGSGKRLQRQSERGLRQSRVLFSRRYF